MSTVVELPPGETTETGFNRRVHVKGASEIVLDACQYYLDDKGQK
jgi:hypothetical protein